MDNLQQIMPSKERVIKSIKLLLGTAALTRKKVFIFAQLISLNKVNDENLTTAYDNNHGWSRRMMIEVWLAHFGSHSYDTKNSKTLSLL